MDNDNLIQEANFIRKGEEKTAEVLNTKLNKKELLLLQKCMIALHQPKKSTALKQLASIGAKVVLDESVGKMIQIVLENKRKNLRVGIVDVETEINAKVALNS